MMKGFDPALHIYAATREADPEMLVGIFGGIRQGLKARGLLKDDEDGPADELYVLLNQAEAELRRRLDRAERHVFTEDNRCDNCGTDTRGELFHSDEFGGALCERCLRWYE